MHSVKLLGLVAMVILAAWPCNGLQFAFTTATCDELAFQYTLDKSFESSAKRLLVNYEDETVASFDLNGQTSGTGNFDPTVITQAGEYSFVIALSSDRSDVLADDGSCYEPGKRLDAVSVVQQATCSQNDGEGTGDDDVEAPGTNGGASDDDFQEGTDGSEASPTSAVVDDGALSSLSQQASTVSSLATPTATASISLSPQTTASIVGSTQPSTSATATNAASKSMQANSMLYACLLALLSCAILNVAAFSSA